MHNTFIPPSNMSAWQYTTARSGIEKNLSLNVSAPLPKAKPNQHLIQIIAVALNPVDYKLCEITPVSYFFISKPATPCVDFSGCIITPAAGSNLKPGQLVFGLSGSLPLIGGALREYNTAEANTVVPLPEGVNPIDAAGIGVAGLTAYQSIISKVKQGDSIFINGGSGGVGVFGIQIAKILGCHVTTSCSSGNVELCKQLGADEVIDYTKGSVLLQLKNKGRTFDHIVDNVGTDKELLTRGFEVLKESAIYVRVAGDFSFKGMMSAFKRKILPGKMKGRTKGFFPKPNTEHLSQLGQWMKEGKIKAVIDTVFPFEDVPEAFERLKTGRARGKVVVNVAFAKYEKA